MPWKITIAEDLQGNEYITAPPTRTGRDSPRSGMWPLYTPFAKP